MSNLEDAGPTNFTLNSRPVSGLKTFTLIHGGGVMGRRSCRDEASAQVSTMASIQQGGLLTLSPNPHMRALWGCWTTTSLDFVS